MATPYRKILFATDLSDLSLQAWPHAVALAEKFGSELLIATVLEEPYVFADGDNYSLLLRSLKEIRPVIEQRVADVARRAPASVRARSTVIESSHVAKALQELATQEGCDLVVVATHGRGGLQHLLLGSVAEKMLRISTIPVLVVRPQAPH